MNHTKKGKRVVLGEGYLVHVRDNGLDISFVGLKNRDGSFYFMNAELYAWQKKVRLVAEVL